MNGAHRHARAQGAAQHAAPRQARHGAAPAAGTGAGMRSPRILLADDDGITRDLLASMLRELGGAEIVPVPDGQRALEALRAPCAFDLAFLDIDMPGLSGLEVLMLAKGSQPRCRWVIISAHSAVANVMASLDAGASGFVVKPFSANKIVDMLTRCGITLAA